MKITNELGLPAPIVNAIRNDDYDRGASDITVTQLIQPPQKVALETRNADVITQDASEMIWALMGKSIHKIIEQADNVMPVEDRLYMPVRGWTLGGMFDRLVLFQDLDGIVIQDYKVTSAWSLALEKTGFKQEWVEQLNLLAELFKHNHTAKVAAIEVVCMLRDWSKLEALRNRTYPQRQVMIIRLPLWPSQKTVEFIYDRVALHQEAAQLLDGGGPGLLAEHMPCSASDRWEKPTKYAVMKTGRKSAVRVFEDLAAASALAKEKNHHIVVRPGACTRCESYCYAAPFCAQWRQKQAADAKEALDAKA